MMINTSFTSHPWTCCTKTVHLDMDCTYRGWLCISISSICSTFISSKNHRFFIKKSLFSLVTEKTMIFRWNKRWNAIDMHNHPLYIHIYMYHVQSVLIISVFTTLSVSYKRWISVHICRIYLLLMMMFFVSSSRWSHTRLFFQWYWLVRDFMIWLIRG